jgi:hydroxyacylglutathione hydrolase
VSLGVESFVNGRWKQNCYIVSKSGGEALVIDPGSQADELIALIEQKQLRVLAVVNTHGHFDHVGAVAALKDRFGVPFYLHGADARMVERGNLFRMVFEARDPIPIPKIEHDIAELPDNFEVGPFRIAWIPTPGHTEGSVCLLMENYLFSGDTLMRNSIGRSDLPGGNREKLLTSIRKLMSLPGELVVCGGHGPRTTIAAEFSAGSRVLELVS